MEQPVKQAKPPVAEGPNKKKLVKKKTSPKQKTEVSKTSLPDSGISHEYEEFFQQLRWLTREQHERGGVHENPGKV